MCVRRIFRCRRLPEMYYPAAQLDGAFLSVIVRSSRPAASLRPELVAAIHSLDPGLPIDQVQPYSEVLAQASADRRLSVYLLGRIRRTRAPAGRHGYLQRHRLWRRAANQRIRDSFRSRRRGSRRYRPRYERRIAPCLRWPRAWSGACRLP